MSDSIECEVFMVYAEGRGAMLRLAFHESVGVYPELLDRARDQAAQHFERRFGYAPTSIYERVETFVHYASDGTE